MAIQVHAEICERLKTLGYENRNRIRMYGEEFDLTSNPVPDENGGAEGCSRQHRGASLSESMPVHVKAVPHLHDNRAG